MSGRGVDGVALGGDDARHLQPAVAGPVHEFVDQGEVGAGHVVAAEQFDQPPQLAPSLPGRLGDRGEARGDAGARGGGSESPTQVTPSPLP